MRQKSGQYGTAEAHVKEIRRATRRQHNAEEKIPIVLEGLRGEYSIAELCRKEGIAQSLYYKWSKEFLEAGKKRLTGDTECQATTGEIKDLRREVLNAEWFATTRQAQTVINTWLRQYNHVRPHQALGLRPLMPENLVENGQLSGTS